MVNKLWSDEQPKDSGFYWFKGADGKGVVAQIKRGVVVMFAGVVAPGPGKWSRAIRFPSLYEANKVEKGLKDLTLAVTDFLVALDAEMKVPGNPPGRGARLAMLSNRLNMANDVAMHFALNMEFNSIGATVKKRERLLRRSSEDLVLQMKAGE